PLRVVGDQVFSPTYAPDLAAALLSLVESGARGLFHVTNTGQCSWHELAEFGLARARLDVTVERIQAKDLGLPAARPPFSVLENARSRAMGLRALRPWPDAVAEHIGGRGARA